MATLHTAGKPMSPRSLVNVNRLYALKLFTNIEQYTDDRHVKTPVKKSVEHLRITKTPQGRSLPPLDVTDQKDLKGIIISIGCRDPQKAIEHLTRPHMRVSGHTHDCKDCRKFGMYSTDMKHC